MTAFIAILRGRFEVPPVNTVATGEALFQLSSDGRRLHFFLKVRNIQNVTQAHIHLGRPGLNGPVVVFLFGLSKFGISVRRDCGWHLDTRKFDRTSSGIFNP